MKYTSLEAYSAAHKAISDAEGAATKRFDDARGALKGALDDEARNAELAKLTDDVTKAMVARDDLRKGLAQLEGEHPELDRERQHEAQKTALTRSERPDAFGLVAAEVVAAKLVDGVDFKDLRESIPPGKLSDNIAVGVALLADKILDIMGDPPRSKDEHAEVLGIGAPTPSQPFAPELPRNALPAGDAGSPEVPALKQYVAELGQAIAQGADFLKAEQTASQNLHVELTGKRFDKAEGLADAVGQELEARHGEQARNQYEEMRGAAMKMQEQELQRTTSLAGHVA